MKHFTVWTALLLVSCVSSPYSTDIFHKEVSFEEYRNSFNSASLLVELQKFTALITLLEQEGLSIEDIEEGQRAIILIQASLLTGDLDTAEQVIQQLLREDAGNRDALFFQALVADVQQDSPRAKKILEQLLEQHPDDLPALSFLGEILLQEKDYDAAEKIFLDNLNREENYVARRGLGHLYMEKKNYAAAENMFTKAITLNKDDSLLYSDRALARALQNAIQPALADLNQSIQLLPDYAWNYLDKGKMLMELQRFSEAAESFTAFLEREEIFIGYAYRGQAHEFSGELSEALSDYQQTLQMQPDYTPAFASLAITAYQLEEYSLAAEYFSKAFYENETPFFEYALLTGISLLWLSKEKEARNFLEPVLKTLPSTDIFYYLIRLYLGVEREDLVHSKVLGRKTLVDAVKGRIYLGIWYDLNENTRIAQKLYEDGIQEDTAGLFETRIARHRLKSLSQP